VAEPVLLNIALLHPTFLRATATAAAL